jgi:hypothetical protein
MYFDNMQPGSSGNAFLPFMILFVGLTGIMLIYMYIICGPVPVGIITDHHPPLKKAMHFWH